MNLKKKTKKQEAQQSLQCSTGCKQTETSCKTRFEEEKEKPIHLLCQGNSSISIF